MSDTPETPLRATAIKAGRLSMAHMHHAMTQQRPDASAMRFGRLFHAAILEPDKFAALPKWEGGRRAGKAWDAFKDALAEGADYVTDDDMDAVEGIRASVNAILRTLPPIEQTEKQVNWADKLYGAATARLDGIMAHGRILELKTCANISERAFRSQAWSMGYNVQLGWYDHGARQAGYAGGALVVAVENHAPYCAALYDVPQGVLTAGYEEAKAIAIHYRACELCGRFPGPYDGQTLQLEPPAWAGGDAGEADLSNGEMGADEL